jgi:hypothetical protein
MRFSEMQQRASQLKKEIDDIARIERDYAANPTRTLEDLRSHRERQKRFLQISEELTQLAEETVQ